MAGAPVLTEGILLLSSFQQRNTGLRQPTSPFQQHPSLARYALGRGRTLERSRLGPPEQAQGPRSQRRIPPHPSSPPHAVGVPPASLGPSSLLSGLCRDQGPLLSALPPTWAHLAGGAQAHACLTPLLESACGPYSILSETSRDPDGSRAQSPQSFHFLGNSLHLVVPSRLPSSPCLWALVLFSALTWEPKDPVELLSSSEFP